MECKISCHKIGGSLLALLLVVGVHVEVWAEFSGAGDGDSENPYEIATAEHLDEVREDLDAHYVLVDDIDLSGEPNWDPIGDDTTPFTGSFDGDFHTIENLTIDRGNEDYVGLFGSTDDATISNLTLENVDISGENRVGAVAGNFDGVMSKVAVDGTVIGSDDDIGGVAGVSSGDLDQVIADVQVDGGGGGDSHTGGLVAINNGSIINSATLGDIVGPKPVGGLVGENNGSIEKTYAAGVVSSRGPGDGEGGLVGDNNGGTISDSYWNEELNDLEDGDVTAGVGVGDGSGVQGRNISDMQWPDAYDEMESLDFDNEWGANPDDNDGYPFLQWQDYQNIDDYISTTLTGPADTTGIPFEVDVKFGDDIDTDFTTDDVEVTNGTADNITGEDAEWTIFIIPDAATTSEDVTIQVEAGAVENSEGDPNEASNELIVTHNPVSVTLEGPTDVIVDPNETSASPFEVRAEFGEDIDDYDENDITVTGGQLEVSGISYDGSDVLVLPVNPDDLTQQEDIIIDLAGGALTAVNGGESEQGDITVTYIPFTAELTGPEGTNQTPFEVAVEFGQGIDNETDIDESQISVSNGDVVTGSLTEVDSQNWTFEVDPENDFGQIVEILVPAGAATGEHGGQNEESNQLDVWHDNTPFTAEMTSDEGEETDLDPFGVTIDFNKEYDEFDINDLVDSNVDQYSNVDTSAPDQVTFDVHPDGDGTVEIRLPAADIEDLAGNILEADAEVSVEYDGTPPEVAGFEPQQEDPTNESPIYFDLEFSKTVVNVDGADETVFDITDNVDSFSVTGEDSTYTVEVIPEGDGTVEIGFTDGQIEDDGGNTNPDTETATIEYNTSSPTVTITVDPDEPTNQSNITFDLVFSEDIPELEEEDFTLSGNVINENLTGSGTNYTLTVEAIADGDVVATLEEDSFADAAGNTNDTEFSESVEYNSTPPTAEIELAQGFSNPTNEPDIEFDITFSEPVPDLTAGDFTLTNTTGTPDLTGADDDYTLTVTPDEDGDVIVELEEGSFTDAFGNDNEEEASASVVSNTSDPEVDEFYAIPDDDPTNENPIPFFLSFTEPVVGLQSDDLDERTNVQSVSISGSGEEYIVEVTPPGDGEVVIGFDDGGFVDEAGNENTTSNETASINYNGSAPEVLNFEANHDPITSADPIEFNIEFSEEIPDLSSGAFNLSRASFESLTTANDIDYTLTVSPNTDGEVIAELPVGSFEDAAGNENEDPFSASVIYDGTRPSVTSFEPVQDPTNENPITFELTFSEPVYELDDGDFEAGSDNFFDSATIVSGADGDTQFTIEVDHSATGTGEVEVVLPENSYEDEAGNGGHDASATVTFDETDLEIVALEPASWVSDPTASDPFEVRLEFNKELAELDLDDLDVTDGDPDGYSTSNYRTFYIDISPTITDGTVTIEAPSGVFEDLAGNTNINSETTTVNYDGDIPTVELELIGWDRNAINEEAFTVEATFSEEVEGLEEDDISLFNADVENIDPDENTSTFTYTIGFLVGTQPGNDIAIKIDEDAAETTGGTGNQESDPLFIWYDDSALTAEFSTEEDDPTDAPQFEVELQFNKDEIYDFDPFADLIADNADITEVDEITEYIYTITLEPVQEGNVTLTLPQGVAEDRASNENEEEVFQIYFEEDPPEVVSIEPGPDVEDPTNQNPFEVEITFSKEIADFYEDGLTVTNASATDFTTSDDITFLVEITPDDPDGVYDIEVEVPAGVYEDHAGNSNLQDEEFFSIGYNGTNLTVELVGPEYDATNEDPFEVDLIFSEPAYDLELGDIFVNNGNAIALEGNDGDEVYTVTISPDDGDEVNVDIQLNSGRAEDIAGNENLSSELLTVLYDETPFTAAFDTEEEDPTISEEFEVTLTFNKEVIEDFESELIVNNGDFADLQQQSENEYTFNLLPDDYGIVEVILPEDVTEDPAGNPNDEATFEIEFAPDRPQVISVEPGQNTNDPTSLDPFYVNIEFDQDIDVFDETGVSDADGIVVDNGSVVGGGQIVAGNDRLFEVEISPNGEGDVTIVEIPQGVAVADGVENELWDLGFSIYYDPNRPIVERIDPGPGITDPTGAYPFQVEIEFSKPIVNFNTGDLNIHPDAEGTGFATDDNQTFIVDITPDDVGAQHEIFVEVPPDVFEDAAGNTNEGDTENFSIFYDGLAPWAEFEGPEHDATRHETFDVEIVFDDDIDTYDQNGIQIDNGDLQQLTRLDSDRFRAVIETDRGTNGDEFVTVSMYIEHDYFQNDNGTGNLESGVYEVTFDVTELTAEMSTTEPDTTSAEQILVSLEFNKEVFNLDQGDFTVTNASLINFQDLGDGNFNFELVPDEDGEVIVELPEGAAEDAATNQSPEVIFDIVSSQDPPEITEFTPIPDDPTNEAEIDFEIKFSKPITGLTLADVNTTNADKVDLTGSGDSRILTVQAVSEGLVEVEIPADRYEDTVGNRNTTSASSSITYDITRPEVAAIEPATGYDDPTNQSPFEVEIQFTKELTDFDAGDLDVEFAEATDWSSSDNETFIVEITPDEPADDAVIEISVPENVYTDHAGNLNEADDLDFDITYRGTPPIVDELSGPEHNTTNQSPFEVYIEFSEEVSGFTTNGFNVTNGEAIQVDEDGQADQYIALIEPDAGDSVEVIIQVAEDAVENEAGNGNEESAELTVVYDVTPFTVEMESDEQDPTNADDFPLTLTFNKPVFDLDLGDLDAVNADLNNLSQVDDDEYTVEVSPLIDGPVTVTIPDGSAAEPPVDAAGNIVEAEDYEIESNRSLPFVEIFDPVPGELTNEAEVDFEITFSEPIEDLELDDFVYDNARDVGLQGSEANYILTVEAEDEGLVTITLPDDTYQDAAGNRNEQDTLATVEYDPTPPYVQQFNPVPDVDSTNAGQIDFEITFSEPVEDLVDTDFETTNAQVTNLTGDEDERVVRVEPLDDGEVKVKLNENTFRDLAGNYNVEPDSASIIYDNTAPEVYDIYADSDDPTNDAEIDFKIIFTESVTNLEESDFVITNAGNEQLQGQGDEYTLTVTAIDSGDVIVELPGNRFEDHAGNRNEDSAEASVVYNNTDPFVTSFEPINNDPTNEDEIQFEITTSEPVYGLNVQDFDVDNGFRYDLDGEDGDDSYILTITTANEGEITVTLNTESFEDAAGNENSQEAVATIEYDITPPTIEHIQALGDDPTSMSFIEFDILLSEEIYHGDLDQDDFIISNASFVNLENGNHPSDSTDNFILLVEAEDYGLVEATLTEESFTDAAGNLNEDSATDSVKYDNEPPVVEEFEAIPDDPTNNEEIDFKLVFSEPVFDIDTGDFDLVNAEDPQLTVVEDDEFTLTVTAQGHGMVEVTLPADRFEDEAGNRNQQSEMASIMYDNEPPFVEEFTTVNDDPTNDSEITFEIKFSEPVYDLRLSDFEPSNVSRVDLEPDEDGEDEYTLIVEASNEGPVEITLPEETFEDEAGNLNTGSASASIIYDDTPPVVEKFEPIPDDPTGMAFIEFELHFSELVTDLHEDDFDVVNGTAVNVLPDGDDVEEDEYTLLVEADEGGLVEVTLPEDSFEDLAGNRNNLEYYSSITFDDTAPRVTEFEPVQSDPTNESIIEFDITFSEAVYELEEDDFELTNADQLSLSGDDDSYSISVHPIDEGDVVVELPSGSYEDAAGNTNIEGASAEIEYDITPPELITFEPIPGDLTNDETIEFELVFSEPVADLRLGDFELDNALGSELDGEEDEYTLIVQAIDHGTVTATLEEGEYTDLAGNPSDETYSASTFYDENAPEVVEIVPMGDNPTNEDDISFEVTFSEPVVDLELTDFELQNATYQGFFGDEDQYVIEVEAIGEDTVTVTLPEDTYEDEAGNRNETSASAWVVYDITEPYVTYFEPVQDDPTNQQQIEFEITFSEPIQEPEVDDFTITGGTGIDVDGEEDSFTLSLEAETEGEIEVTLAPGSFFDLAGNTNTQSAESTIEYDITPPAVTEFRALSDNPTNEAEIEFEITFSEKVEQLELDDFDLTNASPGNLTGQDDQYLLTVQAVNDGEVTATLPEQVYTDKAGNYNEESDSASVVYDASKPFVEQIAPADGYADPTSSDPFFIDIRFNQEIEDFDENELIVTNGQAEGFSSDNDTTFTVEISPDQPDEHIVIEVEVPADVFTDIAGNTNLADDEDFSIVYDGIAPTVQLTGPEFDITNEDPFEIQVEFSKEVSGLDEDGFTTSDGEVIDVEEDGSPDSYIATIAPPDEELIDISIIVTAGAAQDIAGNNNESSDPLIVTYDVTPFTIEFSSDENELTNEQEFEVLLEFNKTALNLSASDLDLDNATLSSFDDIDDDLFSAVISPLGNGEVTLTVPEAVAEDQAGNPNEEGSFEIVFDNTPPEVITFEPVPDDPTNESEIDFDITFSVNVTDLSLQDFELTNADPVDLTGDDDEYRLTVNAEDDGLVEVTLPEDSYENIVGTRNADPATSSITFNGSRPRVEQIAMADGYSNPTNQSPFEIAIEFSEEIVDFDESLLAISNAEAVDFTTDNDTTYIVEVVPNDPEGEAEIEIEVPVGAFYDTAGNPLEESDVEYTVFYDSISPLVTLVGPEYNSTNEDPFEVEILLSEPVVEIDESDIFILNGTVTEVLEGDSDEHYIARVEPADGDNLVVSLQINSGSLEDEAGNANEVSNNLNVRYDTTPLTVELSSEEEEETHNNPFEVTVQFNKTVYDFDENSLGLINVSSVDIIDEGDGEFTLQVSPQSFDEVVVAIPEGAVEDPAGNENEEEARFEIEYTPERPEVVRVEADEEINDPTNVDPIRLEIEFSLEISLFREGELDIINGSVQGDASTDDDRTFMVDIRPESDGQVTVNVPEGVAFTGDGGENLPYEDTFTIIYDGSRPTISFDTNEDDPTRSSEFTVSIMFSDRVFGFDVQDIFPDNANIIDFNDAARDSFSVRIEPITDGLVTLNIPEGVTEDAAGNSNEEGEFTITYNSTPPPVVLSAPDNQATDIPVETKFDWESTQRAETYHLQVSDYEEFNSEDIIRDIDDIESSGYEVETPLSFERTYYWRVRGINDEGSAGEWSEIRSFTTVKEIPPQVTLDFPEDGKEDVPLQPEFNWLSADRADSYDLQVSTDGAFSNHVVNENEISGTDFPITENLSDAQTYYWRVRATNDAGAGEWSETFSFETILRPPGEVVLETPTDSTGSVQLDPMLAWSSAERAEHYVIEIAEEGNFDQPVMVLEDVEDVEVAINDELDWFTIYDWRVRAVNESDAGEWSDVGTFISKAEPPELLFPNPGAVDISSAPSISWASNHNGVEFEYMIFDDDELQSMVTDGNTDTTAVVVSGLEDAKTHYLRVRVIDELTTSDWSDTKVFSTRSNPAGREFSNTIRFSPPGDDGANMIPEDSRLIGLPGSENFILDEVIEGAYMQDWRAFHDTGEEEDYFVEFEADNDSLEFGEGAAYWVIHRDAVSVDDEIRPVLPTDIDTYPIELHPGWNIITNPFFDSVDWNLVKAFNLKGLEEYGIEGIPADFNEMQLFGYSSLFIEEEVMRPMKGYYFYNNPEWELEELHIPFTDFEARGLPEPEIEEMVTDPEASRIALQARWAGDDQDNEEASGNQFITSVDMVFSSDNPERFNSPYPSLQQSHYGMAINSGDAGKRSSLRRTTGSVYNEEGTEYEVDVKAPVGETLTWTADFEEMSDQARLMIVNPVTRKSYIFDNGDEIEIDVTEPEVTYTVYVGDEAYIKEIEENLLPDQVTLKDNYPNPFNPTTTIRYALVEEENVRIEVFDILGRRVQTLVDNEQQSAGWYTVEFDGSALASGTYIYRLVAGNEIKTGKMMLVK